MASTQELKSYWRIRFYDSGRHPKRTRIKIPKEQFPRRRDAEREAKRLQALYDYEGDFDPWVQDWPGAPHASGPEALTVAEAVARYCREKRDLGRRGLRGGWNAKTHHNAKGRLEHFAKVTGERKPVKALTTDDAARYIFRGDLTQATRRAYRRILRAFAGWLEDEGHHDGLTMPPPFKRRGKRKSLVYEGELEAICAEHRRICVARCLRKHATRSGPSSALARRWMGPAWRLMFYQCLRRGEVLELKVGAFDLARRQMYVGDKDFLPKGQTEDTIPITPPAVSIIEHYARPRGQARPASEYLFPSRSTKPLYNSFKRAAYGYDTDELTYRGSELEGGMQREPAASLHSLRRGGITYWLDQGKSYRQVKYLARHKSVTTTEGYDQYTIGSGGGGW